MFQSRSGFLWSAWDWKTDTLLLIFLQLKKSHENLLCIYWYCWRAKNILHLFYTSAIFKNLIAIMLNFWLKDVQHQFFIKSQMSRVSMKVLYLLLTKSKFVKILMFWFSEILILMSKSEFWFWFRFWHWNFDSYFDFDIRIPISALKFLCKFRNFYVNFRISM
jgi:hypothetical protein